MDQKLAKLLEKKRNQSSAEPSIDWDSRRNRYLQDVSDLYTLVEAFLGAPILDGTVQVHRRKKELTENFIGTYSVDDLVLFFGREQVRFSPRGRNILGAQGRLDIIGERGESTLILRDSAWLLVQARQPDLRVVPFDESVFAETLGFVMLD